MLPTSKKIRNIITYSIFAVITAGLVILPWELIVPAEFWEYLLCVLASALLIGVGYLGCFFVLMIIEMADNLTKMRKLMEQGTAPRAAGGNNVVCAACGSVQSAQNAFCLNCGKKI